MSIRQRELPPEVGKVRDSRLSSLRRAVGLRHKKARAAWLPLCLILVATTSAWAASKERVLYSFKGVPDGVGPDAALVFDSSGNLYGTTYEGGTARQGTVFELSPGSGGQWSESVPHSFNEADGDGAYPKDSLLVDSSGDLYGTTWMGGSGSCYFSCGIVFEVSPEVSGGWTESILYNFSGADGANPDANLIADPAGAFYGTTQASGAYGGGAVFRLEKEPGATWSETLLYSFKVQGGDGVLPLSGLLFDPSGNLYGTTYGGGAYNKGTVFELKRGSRGGWTEIVLHSFDGHDGAYPVSGLTIDPTGSLYGVCPNGGPHHNGAVFKLTPGRNNKWAFTILYDFPRANDGAYPVGTLIWDSKGSLYGANAGGGNRACYRYGCGTVFKLSPRASGKWTYTVLYRFNGQDGEQPEAGLIWDAKGNLYGTTFGGGPYGEGVAFELTP